MKICQLTNTYRPHVGGVARSVETLTEQCRALGHEVLVVAPSFRGDRHERGHGLLRVPALQNFNGSDFSVRVPLPQLVRRRIRRFGPDVIHSHHPFLMGDTALRMAREFNRPLVFTHHTLYENYTHYVPFDSPALKRFAIELATEYANACNAVIAPSRSVEQLLRSRGVQTLIRVIPTGIDAESLAGGDAGRFRARYGLDADAPVIGHVGRLAREKNLGFLASAVAPVVARSPRARCAIVGDGPEGSRVRRIFTQAGAGDRLVMPGKLTGQALLDAYAAMDLFVFCSLTETQGMVLAEAMAAGCPVVALDGPGVRDVVVDGDNGRLLPADVDPATAGEAVAEALGDERQCRRWARAARESARRFDQVRCARSVVELYESLEQSAAADRVDWDWWDRLQARIEAEWTLLSSKAESAGRGLGQGRGGTPDQRSTNSKGH
jgi:glycosyltransferase involved in cell wall biosynthesis